MKFCPECGANQLAAASRAAAASETAAHHMRPQLYAVGTVAAFALAFTAYGILHRNEPEQNPVVQVHGSVYAPQGASAVTVTSIPLTPDAPDPSEAPAAPSVAAYAPPAHRLPGSSAMTHIDAAERNAASQRRVFDQRAPARKGNASVRADVARNLASARASLDKNTLGPARTALMSVLAGQPGNGEAQQMQAELVSREGERDVLLGYARLCAREGQWVCAWHNAGHALTVDASSQEARALLSRAIAEHGASASRSFDPSLPGADND